MKKILSLAIIILFLFIACGNQDKTKALEKENAELKQKIILLEAEIMNLKTLIAKYLAKQKLSISMGDLKSIVTAIESYITDWMYAPQVSTITELQKLLQPFHIKNMPTVDPWGNEWKYFTDIKKKNEEYSISCAGPDGLFGTNDDIIFANGEFTKVPQK